MNVRYAPIATEFRGGAKRRDVPEPNLKDGGTVLEASLLAELSTCEH